jgi:hypothetical protein
MLMQKRGPFNKLYAYVCEKDGCANREPLLWNYDQESAEQEWTSSNPEKKAPKKPERKYREPEPPAEFNHDGVVEWGDPPSTLIYDPVKIRPPKREKNVKLPKEINVRVDKIVKDSAAISIKVNATGAKKVYLRFKLLMLLLRIAGWVSPVKMEIELMEKCNVGEK